MMSPVDIGDTCAAVAVSIDVQQQQLVMPPVSRPAAGHHHPPVGAKNPYVPPPPRGVWQLAQSPQQAAPAAEPSLGMTTTSGKVAPFARRGGTPVLNSGAGDKRWSIFGTANSSSVTAEKKGLRVSRYGRMGTTPSTPTTADNTEPARGRYGIPIRQSSSASLSLGRKDGKTVVSPRRSSSLDLLEIPTSPRLAPSIPPMELQDVARISIESVFRHGRIAYEGHEMAIVDRSSNAGAENRMSRIVVLPNVRDESSRSPSKRIAGEDFKVHHSSPPSQRRGLTFSPDFVVEVVGRDCGSGSPSRGLKTSTERIPLSPSPNSPIDGTQGSQSTASASILSEFLATERTYVRELSSLASLYVHPLQKLVDASAAAQDSKHQDDVKALRVDQSESNMAPSSWQTKVSLFRTLFGNILGMLEYHLSVFLPCLEDIIERENFLEGTPGAAVAAESFTRPCSVDLVIEGRGRASDHAKGGCRTAVDTFVKASGPGRASGSCYPSVRRRSLLFSFRHSVAFTAFGTPSRGPEASIADALMKMGSDGDSAPGVMNRPTSYHGVMAMYKDFIEGLDSALRLAAEFSSLAGEHASASVIHSTGINTALKSTSAGGQVSSTSRPKISGRTGLRGKNRNEGVASRQSMLFGRRGKQPSPQCADNVNSVVPPSSDSVSSSLLLQDSQIEDMKEWLKIFNEAISDPRHSQINLASYLLLPLQRLTRYSAMLQRLHEAMPLIHPDRAEVSAAVANFRRFVEDCNESRRRAATEISVHKPSPIKDNSGDISNVAASVPCSVEDSVSKTTPAKASEPPAGGKRSFKWWWSKR